MRRIGGILEPQVHRLVADELDRGIDDGVEDVRSGARCDSARWIRRVDEQRRRGHGAAFSACCSPCRRLRARPSPSLVMSSSPPRCRRRRCDHRRDGPVVLVNADRRLVSRRKVLSRRGAQTTGRDHDAGTEQRSRCCVGRLRATLGAHSAPAGGARAPTRRLRRDAEVLRPRG